MERDAAESGVEQTEREICILDKAIHPPQSKMMEIRYFTPLTKHYLTQGVGLGLGLANSNMVERPQTTNVDPSPIVILKCRCLI